MTNQEVVDYVLNTPNNTNPVILKQMLKEVAGSGGNIDLGVTGATVGQIIKISTVDENGKPTAWTPVDFPSSGDLNTETWTFQLADGSVVTKEVYVK